jgi:apolipoprotein N-acyltransferase
VPVEPITRILLDIGVVLLFAYLGLYVGAFAWLTRRWGLWAAPLIWPLLEFLRTKSQIGFPWGLLGYTMTPYVPFIQPASIGGVYLVSAWLVLVNVLLYKLYASRFTPDAPDARREASGVRRNARRMLGPAMALAVAFAVPLVFALFYIRPLKPWFNVAIIQPNVSPFDKGDWDSRSTIQADLVRLTQQSAAEHPDLILYPETATLTDVTRSESMGQAIRGLADSLQTDIFTGSPLFDERRRSWHNGAVLIRPGEAIKQRYYKIRLVPFSEKIPYADELPIIRRILGTADMGDWARGHDYTVFHWSRGTLSALICFEAIFPDHAREFTRRGSQLIAVVTNDGWFGRLVGAQQHAELAVLRTVENGVPMIRSANNGISFVVDPYGRILRQTSLFVQTILSGPVPQTLAPTLYRRYGDWFMPACVLGLAIGLLTLRLRARRGRVL